MPGSMKYSDYAGTTMSNQSPALKEVLEKKKKKKGKLDPAMMTAVQRRLSRS
jgi:hypothetical protein